MKPKGYRICDEGTVDFNPGDKKMRGNNANEINGMWKGDEAGYDALHHWARRHKDQPLQCDRCGRRTPKLDCANISQKYKRNVNDWEWLCRKCHMEGDGRLENFKKSRIKYGHCVLCGESMKYRGKLHAYICERPDCPNFGIYQTGIEFLAPKKPEGKIYE